MPFGRNFAALACHPLRPSLDQFYLGRMYNRGWGVVKNYTEAAT